MSIAKIALSISVFIMLSILSACVAQEDLIIPNKIQRLEMVSKYKQCVANATNAASSKEHSDYRNPQELVRASMLQCRGAKYRMLKDYPKGWRKSLATQVDDELFRQEISWLQGSR
ncbi:MAG: hypothetical protein GXP08_04845 [Gammaproteobacteria bacterium]|nr:hypothetical protein [Gammaproteobacteria bacterium]